MSVILISVGMVMASMYAPIAARPTIQTSNQPFSNFDPAVTSYLSEYGMHYLGNKSVTIDRSGNTVDFLQSSLISYQNNTTGYIFTSEYDGLVAGSIMAIYASSNTQTSLTLVPIYSTILKNVEHVILNSSTTYATGNCSSSQHKSQIFAPDYQVFPVGTYSTGWAGWAYSWNEYNTQGLIVFVGFYGALGGAGVTAAIAAAVSAGVALTVASVLIPFILAAMAAIAYVDWMGDYKGVYVGECTSLWGSFVTGHPYGLLWLAHNPVPGGY